MYYIFFEKFKISFASVVIGEHIRKPAVVRYACVFVFD